MKRFLPLFFGFALTLSACQNAPSTPQFQQNISAQAIAPPGYTKPKPCGRMGTLAALPPGYTKPTPCPCSQSVGTKAILPPGYTRPGC